MFIEYVITNFELIVLTSLTIIIICSFIIFFIQNNFIVSSRSILNNLVNSIHNNNVELSAYLNSLNKVVEEQKNSLELMNTKINTLEKEIIRLVNVRGADDMLSLAIELARNGENKETIKEKTGLNDDEIDTIYTYHRNTKNQ